MVYRTLRPSTVKHARPRGRYIRRLVLTKYTTRHEFYLACRSDAIVMQSTPESGLSPLSYSLSSQLISLKMLNVAFNYRA